MPIIRELHTKVASLSKALWQVSMNNNAPGSKQDNIQAMGHVFVSQGPKIKNLVDCLFALISPMI